MRQGFFSGFGGGAGDVASGIVVPLAQQQDFAAAAGPHTVTAGVILVTFENQAAITVFTWPGIQTADQVIITFQGDKPAAPTNPATRRDAGDNDQASVTAGTVEVYISGVTSRKVKLFLVKAGV